MVTYDDKTGRMILKGKITSENYEDVKLSIEEAVKKNDIKAPVLDLNALEYISSAGLRVLLALKKQHDDFRLVNVPESIYDIFEITGFSEILNVQRALEEISVDGLEKIGEGTSGVVYRLNPEQIVKVYRDYVQLDYAEHERYCSRMLISLGIDTAIPFKTARVGNDYALIYELLDGPSLDKIIKNDKSRFAECIEKFASFLKLIHKTKISSSKLPDKKEEWINKVNSIEGIFSDEDIKRITDLIASVPDRDTLVHGDYHTGNVLVKDGELILIDTSDVGTGHPVFDLCEVYLNYGISPTLIPEDMCWELFGVTIGEMQERWRCFSGTYFGRELPDEEMDKMTKALTPFSALRFLFWALAEPKVSEAKVNYCKAAILGALNDKDYPGIYF